MCKISFTVQLKMANKTRERERERKRKREQETNQVPNPATDSWINIGQLPGHIINIVCSSPGFQCAVLLFSFPSDLAASLFSSLSLIISFFLCSTISGLNKLDLMLLDFFLVFVFIFSGAQFDELWYECMKLFSKLKRTFSAGSNTFFGFGRLKPGNKLS